MAHAQKVKYLKSEDDGDHDDEGNVPCKNLHVFSPYLTASPRRSHLCRAFWDLKGKTPEKLVFFFGSAKPGIRISRFLFRHYFGRKSQKSRKKCRSA